MLYSSPSGTADMWTMCRLQRRKALGLKVEEGITKGQGGGLTFGGEATFTIKRSDWGMDSMLKGIADEVTVSVSIYAIQRINPAG